MALEPPPRRPSRPSFSRSTSDLASFEEIHGLHQAHEGQQNPKDLVEEIARDERFVDFLSENFDAVRFASNIISSDAVEVGQQPPATGRTSEEYQAAMDAYVQRIETTIQNYVARSHEDLIGQLTSADRLAKTTEVVRTNVGTLKGAIADIKEEVKVPADNLRVLVRRARRVQDANDLLRKILRLSTALKKLRLSLDVKKSFAELRTVGVSAFENLPTAAESVQEIECVMSQLDASRVEAIAIEIGYIKKASKLVRELSDELFMAGAEAMNQTEIGIALQVFYHLKCLREKVSGLIRLTVQSGEGQFQRMMESLEAVDTEAGSGVTGGRDADGPQLRMRLASQMELIMEIVQTYALQVWTLQKVLGKKRDPFTRVRFLDEVISQGEQSIFSNFWQQMTSALEGQFKKSLARPSTGVEYLISVYPYLRSSAHIMLDRLARSTEKGAASARSSAIALPYQSGTEDEDMHRMSGLRSQERKLFLGCFRPLHDAFLIRSLKRLLAPIQLMFPKSEAYHVGVPSKSDTMTFITAMRQEIESCDHDTGLTVAILGGVNKAINYFANNLEELIDSSKNALHFDHGRPRTAEQAHNIAIVQTIALLESAIDGLSSGIGQSKSMLGGAMEQDLAVAERTSIVRNATKKSQECLEALAIQILRSYLSGASHLTDNVLASMHLESFGGNSTVGLTTRTSSRYITHLASLLAFLKRDHFTYFPRAAWTTKCLIEFAGRLVSVFMKHVCLVKPLGEEGKLKIAQDITQLELAVGNIIGVEQLGAQYEELKSLKKLLFLDLKEIAQDSSLDTLRPSIVWHNLIARGPPDLEMPYVRAGWTPGRYVLWMDQDAGKSETEVASEDTLIHYRSVTDLKFVLRAEGKIWKEVRESLDLYAQRVNATGEKNYHPVYSFLVESGTELLASYEAYAFGVKGD